MKLRKEKWTKITLGEIFKLKSGNALPHAQIIKGEFPVFGGNGIVGYHNSFMVEGNTIVIGRVGEYCGSIHLTKQKSWITDNGLYPIVYFKEINQDYFKAILVHANLNQYAQKTGQPSISQSMVYPVEISLPPTEEQNQIASLFQSIETAVQRVDGQEKNVKALQKSLVNGLLSNPPVFGNLLNAGNLRPSFMGEIAECDKRYPEHEKEMNRFIGLENIEPENFNIQGWGEIADGTTFTKRFVKGDVLFGKRRAYLKKVALADFDGICSGDILVIRAKEKLMLPALLPYYISSEAFIQHAVSTSAGSLSPRTKWKDLSELELQIPDLETQNKILEVLNQTETTITQFKQQKLTLKNLKQKLLNEILG